MGGVLLRRQDSRREPALVSDEGMLAVQVLLTGYGGVKDWVSVLGFIIHMDGRMYRMDPGRGGGGMWRESMRFFSHFLPKSPISGLVDAGEDLGEYDGLFGREEGADDLPGVGGPDVEAAFTEVDGKGLEGEEAEAGLGDLADAGCGSGLGWSLAAASFHSSAISSATGSMWAAAMTRA